MTRGRFEKPGVIEPPRSQLSEGWYDTGDIVAIAPEGYVTDTAKAVVKRCYLKAIRCATYRMCRGTKRIISLACLMRLLSSAHPCGL